MIELTSVGVDIGSSTSHLLFSKITLERLDTRYVVASREIIYQSDILLTPYTTDGDIDTAALGVFIDREYRTCGQERSAIDTGALILTGVAVRRNNARAIGDLFARDAGRFVAVSAGDRLEALMAAQGSGAAFASLGGKTILNLDVGGGTTKLAVCLDGDVIAITAVEAGARLVVTDENDRINRLEDYGLKYGELLGRQLEIGARLNDSEKYKLAKLMSDQIVAALRGDALAGWLRLPPLPQDLQFNAVMFSGGVSEYIYQTTDQNYSDLGPHLGSELAGVMSDLGIPILSPDDGMKAGGIRATVIGASQYTVQVSGSTVYLDPLHAVPLRNVATIQPHIDLSSDTLQSDVIAAAVRDALARIDFQTGQYQVAVALKWQGSATYRRLEALALGLIDGLKPVLAAGHPLIVVTDGDVGGLFGMHCRESGAVSNAIISIDGIELDEFDFIDIGEIILATGAVPVVVKSLVFPNEYRLDAENAA